MRRQKRRAKEDWFGTTAAQSQRIGIGLMSRADSDAQPAGQRSKNPDGADQEAQSSSTSRDKGVHKRRVWTESERKRHKIACKGKSRLTKHEKLEIIRLHNSRDPDVHKTKAELATMFQKSLSAIAKVLKPESIAAMGKS
eukprot:767294-Hanusia_phi.AAC.1